MMLSCGTNRTKIVGADSIEIMRAYGLIPGSSSMNSTIPGTPVDPAHTPGLSVDCFRRTRERCDGRPSFTPLNIRTQLPPPKLRTNCRRRQIISLLYECGDCTCGVRRKLQNACDFTLLAGSSKLINYHESNTKDPRCSIGVCFPTIYRASLLSSPINYITDELPVAVGFPDTRGFLDPRSTSSSIRDLQLITYDIVCRFIKQKYRKSGLKCRHKDLLPGYTIRGPAILSVRLR